MELMLTPAGTREFLHRNQDHPVERRIKHPCVIELTRSAKLAGAAATAAPARLTRRRT